LACPQQFRSSCFQTDIAGGWDGSDVSRERNQLFSTVFGLDRSDDPKRRNQRGLQSKSEQGQSTLASLPICEKKDSRKPSK